jgi:hypothetical protein
MGLHFSAEIQLSIMGPYFRGGASPTFSAIGQSHLSDSLIVRKKSQFIEGARK